MFRVFVRGQRTGDRWRGIEVVFWRALAVCCVGPQNYTTNSFRLISTNLLKFFLSAQVHVRKFSFCTIAMIGFGSLQSIEAFNSLRCISALTDVAWEHHNSFVKHTLLSQIDIL